MSIVTVGANSTSPDIEMDVIRKFRKEKITPLFKFQKRATILTLCISGIALIGFVFLKFYPSAPQYNGLAEFLVVLSVGSFTIAFLIISLRTKKQGVTILRLMRTDTSIQKIVELKKSALFSKRKNELLSTIEKSQAMLDRLSENDFTESVEKNIKTDIMMNAF